MTEVFWFYEDDREPDEEHGIHAQPFVRATPLTKNAGELLEALRGVLRVADRATDEFDAARLAIARAIRGGA